MAMDKLKTICNKYLPILLLMLFGVSVYPLLWRDFWFDEALTLLNFALLPAGDIYWNYAIPNNHILYTLCLHFYFLFCPATVPFDLWCRLLSVIFASGVLVLMYFWFARMIGRRVWFWLLTAMATATPFLIYATAVRGYMLGMLAAAVAAKCAFEFSGKGTFKWGTACFLASAVTVGVTPSNLIALGAAALYAAWFCGSAPWKKLRFYCLGILPLAAFAVFYLPIWSQLIKAANLGEGWSHPLPVLAAWLLAVLIPVLPLFLVLLIVYPVVRRKKLSKNLLFAGIWLLPAVMVFFTRVPPFPRVLVVLYPVIWLLWGKAVHRLLAFLRYRGMSAAKQGRLINIFGLFLLFWTVCLIQTPRVKNQLSNWCGNARQDDFYCAYYVRNDHIPLKTAQAIAKLDLTGVPEIYLSFTSDPWALMLYLQANGMDSGKVIFDGPRGKVENLKRSGLVVIHRSESIYELEQRFGIKTRPVLENTNHRVYQVW